MGIGSEKGILNRVLRIGRITQEAVCPSVESRQAMNQNLVQLLSCSFFACNFIAFVSPNVCICVLHALFLNPPKVITTAYRFLPLPDLKLSPFNRLPVSSGSRLRGELVLSLHAL
jgi:hypothetical protein